MGEVGDLLFQVERVFARFEQVRHLVREGPVLADLCFDKVAQVLERALQLVQALALLLELSGEFFIQLLEFRQLLHLQAQVLVLRP